MEKGNEQTEINKEERMVRKADAVKEVLKELKNEHLGISIVVSGLIDEITNIAKESGLKPHTALLSLGIHGKKSLLPKDNILEITTMCGHGLVGEGLVESVIEKIKSKQLTPKEGARLLAQPCPCGIFNTDRCEELLKNF